MLISQGFHLQHMRHNLCRITSELVKPRTGIRQDVAQSIRMTRGFLIENPQVSGPHSLGIRQALIDGDNANGELHPRGVSFIGGRYLEFEFLAASGDEDDPPHNRISIGATGGGRCRR